MYENDDGGMEMEKKFFNRILYGGDYNPNQWPKDIWEEDMRIFKKQALIRQRLMFFLGRKFSLQKKNIILRSWMKLSKC